MPAPVVPAKPFSRIALSLSGGGYRAASFHLGSMSYLQRVTFDDQPLLEHVKMISTVSGGTITGVIYALMKQQGHSFGAVYAKIMKQLRDVDLLKEGIRKLSPHGRWNNEAKTKNLINAFAELYDDYYTSGATFSVFEQMNSHLECVVFNSTEFRYAIDFRFRNWGTGYFGNNLIRLTPEQAAEVKLADAIASSSCFTGGFEPLLFPNDFLHDDAGALRKLPNNKPLGLMDGGIYDNQGIESILLYHGSKPGREFDLVIISDVASPYMDAYAPGAVHEQEGFRKQSVSQLLQSGNKINNIVTAVLVLLIAVCLAIPLKDHYVLNFSTGLCIGLAVSFLLLLIAKSILVGKVRSGIRFIQRKIREVIPPFHYEKLTHLEVDKIAFGRLEPLVMNRIRSLIKLLMDVFLKIVRRLNYDKLYDNPSFMYRRASNLIRELTQEDYNAKLQRRKDTGNPLPAQSIFKSDYLADVGPHINKVASSSAAFGTTLWFNDEPGALNPMLDQLVASGQFTMCYNLIMYIEELMYTPGNGFDLLDASVRNSVNNVYAQCKADWEKFKADPLWLVGN